MDAWKMLREFLSPRLYQQIALVGKSIVGFDACLREIRLRVGKCSMLQVGDRMLPLSVYISREDMTNILLCLCHGSLYAYRQALSQGYLSPGNGLRVGVAGRAVYENGMVQGVSDVTSLVFRIPHYIAHAGDAVVEAFEQMGRRHGVLVYAPPGGGKTTALRGFLSVLSGRIPIVAVDCREELTAALPEHMGLETVVGYPKGEGILLSVRSLSPACIVCDEIGGAEEADAVLEAAVSGVPLVASAHGASLAELHQRPSMHRLLEQHLFGATVGIFRAEEGFCAQIAYITDEKHLAG